MPSPAAAKAEVYDLTPFTLLDFPDHPAAIVWFAGCNLRCGYCYNPHIVEGRGKLNLGDVLAFLNKRIGLLEGVVFSGGEPTLCKNLLGYAQAVKNLGFKIKLDTNATRPFTVKTLLEQKLLDYVALDFKAPQNAWEKTTGREAAGYDAFLQTLRIAQNSGVAYEVRTTIHPALLGVADLQSMIDTLKSAGYDRPLYVQHYRHGPTLGNLPDTPRPDLAAIGNIHQR